METLLAGYRRFRESGWPEKQHIFEKLADEGQNPRALVIGCIDSRVDPAAIFDTGPGELLTLRNVANLVPAYAPSEELHGTSAALEFGVRVLEIPEIVVLGHGMCSGVAALLNGAPENAQDFVAPWMEIAAEAHDRALNAKSSDKQLCCEREVVKLSLKNLMTFPWIAEKAASGTLSLTGAWFSVRAGRLAVLDSGGTFRYVE